MFKKIPALRQYFKEKTVLLKKKKPKPCDTLSQFLLGSL
jgi:hypothetical protein